MDECKKCPANFFTPKEGATKCQPYEDNNVPDKGPEQQVPPKAISNGKLGMIIGIVIAVIVVVVIMVIVIVIVMRGRRRAAFDGESSTDRKDWEDRGDREGRGEQRKREAQPNQGYTFHQKHPPN